MATPSITNLRPGEGGSFVPDETVSLSTRDADTRVDRASLNAIITFSKTAYLPTALPSGASYLDVFNDALPESRPNVAVDHYLSDDIPYGLTTYGPVLTLEKAIDGEATERGVLHVESEIDGTTPVGCEIQLGIQSYTTASSDYFSDAGYAGVVAGFVYWPLDTGVFVFFKDDGTKKIVVAGPAQDSTGTRLVSTETTFDWGADLNAPASIRVVWDPTPRLNKVYVLLTVESATSKDETLLFESSISALGTFQTQTRIGNFYSEAAPSRVVAFAGIDSGLTGDFVEIHRIRLEEYGLFLLGAGAETLDSEATHTSSDSVLVSALSDIDPWETSELTGIVTADTAGLAITKTAASTDGGAYWEEPDLSTRKFLVAMRSYVRSASHVGSQSTGIGLDIDDGTSKTSVRFLNDFATERIGVLSGTNLKATTSYHTHDLSWSEEIPEILILADQAQNMMDLFLTTSATSTAAATLVPSISEAYSTVASTYSGPMVSFGFLDAEAASVPLGGTFGLRSLFVLPNCEMFAPYSAFAEGGTPLPDYGPGTWTAWTKTQSSSAPTITSVASAADPHWKIATTDKSQYAFYTLSYAATKYSPGESGVSVVAKIKVESWIDKYASTDSPRLPTCALIAVEAEGSSFVQLQCIQSLTGEKYIFLSSGSSAYTEVLNQTATGTKLSAAVDFTEYHTYLLSYRPGDAIQVYVDFDPTPVIDIPWTEEDITRKSNSTLSSGMTASVGVIPVDGESATLSLGLIGVSVGSGFDFNSQIRVSDQVLEDKIYGAAANVFVDLSDKD